MLQPCFRGLSLLFSTIKLVPKINTEWSFYDIYFFYKNKHLKPARTRQLLKYEQYQTEYLLGDRSHKTSASKREGGGVEKLIKNYLNGKTENKSEEIYRKQ